MDSYMNITESVRKKNKIIYFLLMNYFILQEM